ncbi:MAG TPA: FAD-dependent oxidoreductase [Bryobacteraceae bacterium]|nr:FAD-dependent oxidoreductase [Bryobacteraceae bacterium]
MARKRVVIVGGVAGGASCAARLRRLDEDAGIVILERGYYVSFANCGLPYFVGNVIQEESKLLLASPDLFRERFNIEVRLRNEVISIDRQSREVVVREVDSEREYREPYDALVLSPGAAPIRPALPGVDLPGIFTLRSLPDSEDIRDWIDAKKPRRAVVVGGGFIGLEMAENLVHRGMEVTIIDVADQLMPPLDPEMAEYVRRRVAKHAVHVQLSDGVAEFKSSADGGLVVATQSGAAFDAGLVVLSIGVRPESRLARAAGLEIGDRGGIRVDSRMLTSDPYIWAVGDAVEVKNRITGKWEWIPLAGPANRQGRVAADVVCGRNSRFSSVQGTAICGFFGLTAALTGVTEKALRQAGIEDFQAVYLHPAHHAGYYPGAKPIHLKILFRGSDGLLLGAQAVGEEGVERRIDVIAMAIQMGGTVFDLEEAELCYAPQYGSAKDPVNLAGMAAANVMRGDVDLASWRELDATDAFLLDVREVEEFRDGSIDGAVNIPLSKLRARYKELPRGREIWVYCRAGHRSYYACRFLAQNGFQVRNLSGGYRTYRAWQPEERRQLCTR